MQSLSIRNTCEAEIEIWVRKEEGGRKGVYTCGDGFGRRGVGYRTFPSDSFIFIFFHRYLSFCAISILSQFICQPSGFEQASALVVFILAREEEREGGQRFDIQRRNSQGVSGNPTTLSFCC